MIDDQPYPKELTSAYQDERSQNRKLIEDMLAKRNVLDAVLRAYSQAEESAKKYIDTSQPNEEFKAAFDAVLNTMQSPEPF